MLGHSTDQSSAHLSLQADESALPHLDDVEHKFIVVNGFRMHYAEAGMGEAIILLHGWPEHWYAWRHQIPVLSNRYRVICPDLRGFGWSDAPKSGYRTEQLADDIVALLDALKLDSVRLMAHDWGGWIGINLCLRYPQRIKRFMALNVGHPFRPMKLSKLPHLWRFWYQSVIAAPILGKWLVNRPTGFVRFLVRLDASSDALSDQDLDIYLERLLNKDRASASVQLYRQFVYVEYPMMVAGRYRQSILQTPTLLCFGAKDKFIAVALLEGYENNAPHMTINLIPTAGHFVMEESPDIINEKAAAWFAQAS